MPRENSFSDSEGRSLTPDLEDELAFSPTSPISDNILGGAHTTEPGSTQNNGRPTLEQLDNTFSAPASLSAHEPVSPRSMKSSKKSFARARSPNSRKPAHTPEGAPEPTPMRPSFLTPGDRFRSTVRKVIAMRKTSSIISRRGVGAEPGVDPRRASANVAFGHIRQQCLIEIVDYSSVRSSFGRMSNNEFIRLLADPRASEREPWAKVRWINVGGISWDVISAMALKYGNLHFPAEVGNNYVDKNMFRQTSTHSP